MEIKVGGRYKRVGAEKQSQNVFLGQEIVVTGFDFEGDPQFKKKLRDGSWVGNCCQPIERFKNCFKPFNMQMRNK